MAEVIKKEIQLLEKCDSGPSNENERLTTRYGELKDYMVKIHEQGVTLKNQINDGAANIADQSLTLSNEKTNLDRSVAEGVKHTKLHACVIQSLQKRINAHQMTIDNMQASTFSVEKYTYKIEKMDAEEKEEVRELKNMEKDLEELKNEWRNRLRHTQLLW